MEESKKWRDFLCILKFSKTGNHSVNAKIISKSIRLTVNHMKIRLESFFFVTLSSDFNKEFSTWHPVGAR